MSKRASPQASDPPTQSDPINPKANVVPGDLGRSLIVGIGASAGGLDACRKLLGTLPDNSGMTLILVQHLDPTHESMMVDLLSGRSSMTVVQATDGMTLAPEHLYVIPPGTYLSVANGALHVSPPQARHGARMPFDFLLRSLAEAFGERAACVILSGTGTDGSLGLKAIRQRKGLVVAQDPNEASHDGMPRNAVLTGEVDLVLPIAKIPDALIRYQRTGDFAHEPETDEGEDFPSDRFNEIIELLRAKTTHDFRSYKPGTIRRRIERRMAMADIENTDIDGYLDVLLGDPGELERLAADLLINVTSFFRDPKVFEFLADTIVPELLHAKGADQSLRVWIAGCSSGEEAYSLAILFREAILVENLNIKLQFFASDVDSDAVAIARDGFYPETIAADVSAARLARFFVKEEHGYRVVADLRAAVVFTVQDVLADPPFSRIDMVSCRNLLIYLRPDAQARALGLFQFALRENGVLLLGSAETVGDSSRRFDVVSKAQRVYRRVGSARPPDLGFAAPGGGGRPGARLGQGQPQSRRIALADLCRRLILDLYAPAAMLINRKYDLLFSLGPTERYLRVSSGHPSHDLLAMVGASLRGKLRSAIEQASQANARIAVPGGLRDDNGTSIPFSIVVHPVRNDGDEFLLICFVEDAKSAGGVQRAAEPNDDPRIVALEQELEVTKTELRDAIRNLEIANEEQKAINEDALSVNEEYQSTNEELLTSKEELQSLNEELTALNAQLQETLERQRTTANDLQNILYSTDIATLFLDLNLDIRFFTPATRALFSVIPSDVGRPLADLTSFAADAELLDDARTILRTRVPIEREIETRNGTWYIRRVLPYRTQSDKVDGIVITFTDISERKQTARALEEAKRNAETANLAKSRFLAAASHDLRQPLQTLSLLQGLLTRKVEGADARKLVALLDPTLNAMSGMLNTLLDINQIDAGIVQPNIAAIPVGGMLARMRDEFAYAATAQGLVLRMVECTAIIQTDPVYLEQMLRNLLANALKYTSRGKILLGCRRRGAVLRVEVWDTGIGIPEGELDAIFGEYHQVENPARERGRGLGLGLSIVRRLGTLLGHRVSVRSRVGRGSVFAIEATLAPVQASPPDGMNGGALAGAAAGDAAKRTGTIVVVEDEPDLRELLVMLLRDDGHHVIAAPDGDSALKRLHRDAVEVDLIVTDYNLPGGMDGLGVVAALRKKQQRKIPAILVTGDISAVAMREIAAQDCTQLSKPVKPEEFGSTIQRLLPAQPSSADRKVARQGAATRDAGKPLIFVVDDDANVRGMLRRVLADDGFGVEDFASSEAFLEAYRPGVDGCLLVDAYLPGMNGLELLRNLHAADHRLPTIMITGDSDVAMAVAAMKAGASDFIEKPINRDELLAGIARALEQARDSSKLSAWREGAAVHVADLTARQRQIMKLVLEGHPSKNIAADLGISQRTVENHRASIMKRTGTKSLPALARLALAATWNEGA